MTTVYKTMTRQEYNEFLTQVKMLEAATGRPVKVVSRQIGEKFVVKSLATVLAQIQEYQQLEFNL